MSSLVPILKKHYVASDHIKVVKLTSTLSTLPLTGSVAIVLSMGWPSRNLRSSSDLKLRMIGSRKLPVSDSERVASDFVTGTGTPPSTQERSRFRLINKRPSAV